jgi:hypothetical protein
MALAAEVAVAAVHKKAVAEEDTATVGAAAALGLSSQYK